MREGEKEREREREREREESIQTLRQLNPLAEVRASPSLLLYARCAVFPGFSAQKTKKLIYFKSIRMYDRAKGREGGNEEGASSNVNF
jgi:hypothetical protein